MYKTSRAASRIEGGGGEERGALAAEDLRWEAVSPLEFTRLSPHPFPAVPEYRRPLWASPAACRGRPFLLVTVPDTLAVYNTISSLFIQTALVVSVGGEHGLCADTNAGKGCCTVPDLSICQNAAQFLFADLFSVRPLSLSTCPGSPWPRRRPAARMRRTPSPVSMFH